MAQTLEKQVMDRWRLESLGSYVMHGLAVIRQRGKNNNKKGHLYSSQAYRTLTAITRAQRRDGRSSKKQIWI